jgi:hypothetical protein
MPSGIFRKQKLSFFYVGANSVGIVALAFDKGLLDAERRVDELREWCHIITVAQANSQSVRGWARICWGRHALILSNWAENSLRTR